jgi:hypothetical protein
MTSTVTKITITTIVSNSYNALSATIGIIAILLLMVLLLQKELLRAAGGIRARLWLQTLNVAIVPLLFTFTLILVVRFVNLLRQ